MGIFQDIRDDLVKRRRNIVNQQKSQDFLNKAFQTLKMLDSNGILRILVNEINNVINKAYQTDNYHWTYEVRDYRVQGVEVDRYSIYLVCDGKNIMHFVVDYAKTGEILSFDMMYITQIAQFLRCYSELGIKEDHVGTRMVCVDFGDTPTFHEMISALSLLDNVPEEAIFNNGILSETKMPLRSGNLKK